MKKDHANSTRRGALKNGSAASRCEPVRRPLPAPLTSRKRLRDYQNSEGVFYYKKNNGCGYLNWEMRLGKTLPTIRFFSQRRNAKRILVIGPYSVLQGWCDELEIENSTVYPIYKIKPTDRREALENTISYDGWFLINKECHLYLDILSYNWDVIICDETWIANPKAKVTKYFLKNTKAKYRVILSGSMITENELQAYCQLKWVNEKILPYKSFWDFRIRLFRPVGMDWKMSLKGQRILAAAINKYCSVLKRKDVGLNKEKIIEKRYIQLSKKARKDYGEIELAFFEGEVLKFAGTRWNKLRRLCSMKEKETELTVLLSTELKNEKVVIWCHYVEEVERVSTLLNCNYIHGQVPPSQREEIRKSFLSKDQYLVAQPQCWKWGTNLSGVDTVIFFSLPNGFMTWEQVQERTVDLSSKDSLLLILLMAENTVEQDVFDGLQAQENDNAMLDRIRRGIQSRNMADN